MDGGFRQDRVSSWWRMGTQDRPLFPEAARNRHCGGCDAACPVNLSVKRGVAAVVGRRWRAPP